jgi:hypothetical protein
LDWVYVVIIDFELQGMERLKDEEKYRGREEKRGLINYG